jgi:putative transposase
MAHGFLYPVALMDWWSRYGVAWERSNSLDSEFCVRAWNTALASGRVPLISNTDQGSQFTSEAFLEAVEAAGVDVSLDGRGRGLDNRFIERLWRSVKQEDIYLQDYADGLAAQRGLARWFVEYNTERPPQALGYATPAERYHASESHGRTATIKLPRGRVCRRRCSGWARCPRCCRPTTAARPRTRSAARGSGSSTRSSSRWWRITD